MWRYQQESPVFKQPTSAMDINAFKRKIMKTLEVRLVPLKIPLKRRLQTMSVIYVGVVFIGFGGLATLIWIAMLFTPYFFISLLYLAWMYYDWDKPRKGGRPTKASRYLKIWRYFAGYFPVHLVKTADLDPTKNYIIGFHPHGILGAGCACNFASEATGFSKLYPGIKPRVLTLDGNFKFPFHREVLMLMGFCSVSKESIEWILTKENTGNAAVIVVGGAQEALDARPGKAILTLKNRKGFVRMAIMNGASLVPIYSFGENDIFRQLYNPHGSLLRILQESFSKFFGFSPPFFYGRGIFNYTFGMIPHRKPIYTVVGKPLDVPRNPNPSQEEVDQVHSQYLRQLKELHDQYKGQYGYPRQEIQFV